MIQLQNINLELGQKRLFENFSLAIKEGSFTGVFGVSGCGKTTLLNIMGLLQKLDSGTVIIGNIKNPRSPEIIKLLRYEISFIFQNYGLLLDETVEKNLILALKYSKATNKQKQQQIAENLKNVGLENFQFKKVATLSGGEQQRVAIARTLVKPGKIILADEPTGNLDTHSRDQIMSILTEINRRSNKTIVMVSHDEELKKYMTNIVELS